jgi:hypothetical protein
MTDLSNDPLIVTALMGDPDFARLDALRRAHFPPERNYLRAHLTLFHHLPPAILAELRDLLKSETRASAPDARLSSLLNLGRGVAYRVESEGLAEIRARIADRFAPLLMPQDRNGWRAHVTVQNKVEPAKARALLATLAAGFQPGPLALIGLAIWHYRGGPWHSAGAWRFGAGHAMTPPK